MPNRTKKDHKRRHHTGDSHWQSFHFSGKLIVCSVIFGFMLVLIGGIVYAIGTDRDDETKSDDYEDLQKKPPMTIVGPVMMGIGGFIVLVGVGMCLFETNVCRKRNVENSPLIEGESAPKDSETAGIEFGSTVAAISPKTRNQNHKKSPSPRRSKLPTKKPHSDKDRMLESTPSKSPSSAPINVGESVSKNFLSASDKFLTPPSSFVRANSRDAENQTSSSLMKSFSPSDNSWTVSADFQTPNASSIENSMSFESSNLREGVLISNISTINSHEFLTPKNSNAEFMNPSKTNADIHTKDACEDSVSDKSSEQECTVTNINTIPSEVIVDDLHKEIEQQRQVNISNTLSVESASEVVNPETKNSENTCSTIDLTTEESTSFSAKESVENRLSTDVNDSSSGASTGTGIRGVDKEQSGKVPLETSSNLETKVDLKEHETLDEQDQKCEITSTIIQVGEEDKQNIKVALEEPLISTGVGHDDSSLDKITDKNAKQQTCEQTNDFVEENIVQAPDNKECNEVVTTKDSPENAE